MADRDDQTGEYNEKYPLETFIHALDHLGEEVGTKDIEQAVSCQYRTAIAKLHELEDRGIVTSRRIGNAYLWSLSENSDIEDLRIEREPNNDELTSADGGDSSRGIDPYDPTDEWE